MIAMIESDLDTSNVQNERQEEKKARWAWSDYITWEIRSASAVAKETCSYMILMRLDRAFSLASWHKLIIIVFNASVDSDETSIMKASDFEMLVEMLFFDDFLTDLHSERTLNVCLQSCKFMSSLFSSSANLTAWFLMTRSRSETQRWYYLSIFFTYLMKTSSLSLFMNLSRLSLIDNDLRSTYE